MALVGRNVPASVGDVREEGSVPGSERSAGGSMATCSCVLTWIPMDRGAWRVIIHGVKELDTTEATWPACTQHINVLPKEHVL